MVKNFPTPEERDEHSNEGLQVSPKRKDDYREEGVKYQIFTYTKG